MAGLASRGRYHFTTQEARRHLKGSGPAIRAVLRRLSAKGQIATPYRGFHVIVPPEYRAIGCLPPAQFVPQLMAYLRQPYYAGLLSAAEFHGAAHQRPQVFSVVVPMNRPRIECGRVRVEFVARLAAKAVPTVAINTPRGPIKVSTPEATALDLVTLSRSQRWPGQCGYCTCRARRIHRSSQTGKAGAQDGSASP